MRIVAPFASMILVCGLAPRAGSTGTIDIQTTPFDNFIVIDITVVDNGGSGGCNGSFTLQRRVIPECNTVDIATFARQPGTSTHRYFDAPLQPSRAYRYEVVACSGFTWTGDCGWGLPIVVMTTTPPAPAFLGRGRLANGVTFYGCPDLCTGGDVVRLPPEGWQYVGTDTPVVLYGGFLASCQNGWLYDVAQVVPSSCAPATDVPFGPTSWGVVKSLYR
jgi:hypothetical protein